MRLIEILHHTKLVTIEQAIESLDTINRALARVRRDQSAKFCSLDSEGHCFVALETQASIAQLLQSVIASGKDCRSHNQLARRYCPGGLFALKRPSLLAL